MIVEGLNSMSSLTFGLLSDCLSVLKVIFHGKTCIMYAQYNRYIYLYIYTVIYTYDLLMTLY